MKGISLKNMEPLTAEEKAFSADLENYDQFFKYMKINKLDQEEWYDILILHYLRAVKKYLNIPHLQQYEFGAVLFKTLDSARSNYCKAMTTQKRMPEGGIYSFDIVLEDDKGKGFHVDSWLIDRKASVEKQVIFKEMFKEFYKRCTTYEDDFWGNEGEVNEYLKCELDLLIEGYSEYQTWKKTEKQFPYGYTLYNLERDIEGFRRIFKEVFGI
jgi:hypothetical protein